MAARGSDPSGHAAWKRSIGLLVGLVLPALGGVWLAAGDHGNGEPGNVRLERGARLFFEETFGGNGRTCATCHEPVNEFTISPALVQSRFSLDPTHPLFRPIDSNDGEGRDFSNLLNHAVVTVRISLHPRVFVFGDPTQRSITVWRGTPSIANVALTAPYLQDGGAATLQEQAAGAIRNHLEPGREAKRHELDAIARFQEDVFYPLRIRSLLDPDEPMARTRGFSVPASSPAVERGRALFDQNCSRCHELELGHRPGSPETPIFVSTFVSQANRLGFSVLKLGFMNPDGTVSVVETTDPGRAAVTGDIADLNAFEIPMLRGLKHTAPYFHDNSAKTLSAVVSHYNEFFGFGVRGEDRDDLITFLEVL